MDEKRCWGNELTSDLIADYCCRSWRADGPVVPLACLNALLFLLFWQIVKMSDTMTMMFEAEDLEQASPATVSRVGMIFCEIRNLDWQPLRDVWLRSLPVTFEEHHPLIVGLFDWLFPAALYFVQKQCVIPTPVTGQVCFEQFSAC